jgi:predicted enzyme related to lactoylglutathione lyase
VAHAIQHGLSNREVAARRGVSVDGIKYHVAQIFAKLGLSSRKELRRWFDVPRHSALAAQDRTMNAPKAAESPGVIGQIARTVGNIQHSVQFYGQVLGLPHLYTFDTLAFFDCNGTRLMLTQQSGTAAESILYFRVSDIAQQHQRLTACGVEFTAAPHMVHRHADGMEEWMAFFKDPDGRTLAIMSQVRPPG